jgi:quercetin dioxygenase-like cupin family protein
MTDDSAREPLIVQPGAGPSHRSPFSDVLAWKAGGDDTGGGYSLQERVAPPGARSPKHVHRSVTEAFYVLGGELEMQIADRAFTAAAGMFTLVPRGVEHAWRNASDADARVLVLFSPPADPRYFEELDALVASGAVDPDAVRALSERYGWT